MWRRFDILSLLVGAFAALLLAGIVVAILRSSRLSVTSPDILAGFAAGFGLLALVCLVALVQIRWTEAKWQRAFMAGQNAAFARERIKLARDLQQRLLPPPSLTANGCHVAARNVPAAQVAGDFYDVIPIPGERLLIVLADVAGSEVDAGMILATFKGTIPFLAEETSMAAMLLGRLNERMSGHLMPRQFLAVLVALWTPADRSLSIANAGLPDPLLIGADGAAHPVEIGGPRYPIGIRRKMNYESVTVKLAPGERVFFFTDGLPESPVKGEPLGYERLISEVERTRGDIDALFGALEKAGAARDDDWTALLFEPAAQVSGTTSSAA